MARARNTASSGEVGRILRAHLDVDTVQKWLDARTFDKEAFAKLFFKPVVELLAWTPRLVKTTLAPALADVYGMNPAEAAALAQGLVDLVTHCRNVRKSMSSGSKTPVEIKAIVDVLGGARSASTSKPAPLSKKKSDEKTVGAEKASKTDVSTVQEITSGEEEVFSPKRSEPSSSSKMPLQHELEKSARSLGIKFSDPAPVTTAAWIDWSAGTAKRRKGSEIEVAQALAPGPRGFVNATFKDSQGKDEILITEMPNLYLTHMRSSSASGKGAKKRPAAAAAIAVESDDQAEDSEEQLAPVPVIKKKATGAKPAAAEVKKKKKESDATPAATAEEIVIDKESIKFKGPFKEQSYIVHGIPPKLIVAVNAKRTQDHGSICRQILEYIQATPGCTKAQALAKRAELLDV